MAAGFSFKMEGLDRVSKSFDQLPKRLVKEVYGEVSEAAQKIRNAAIVQVPVDTGRLKNAIHLARIGPISFEVTAQTNYAAFVEFGTGTFVNVPAGLEDYAIQFKGKGIKQVNIPARPFLFNNYLRERPELIKRLKAILADMK